MCYYKTKGFYQFELILLLCEGMLMVFHPQDFQFLIESIPSIFEALVYVVCSKGAELFVFTTQPRFYEQIKSQNLTFLQYLGDRCIFRSHFQTKYQNKEADMEKIKENYSNQLLKFVFVILVAK